jgi:hypothetical protein
LSVDSRERTELATELEDLAGKGAAMSSIDSELARHSLSGDEYDEMWLYAWSLMEGRAGRIVVGAAGDWYGYAPVEGG